jgi:hypothetical protein
LKKRKNVGIVIIFMSQIMSRPTRLNNPIPIGAKVHILGYPELVLFVVRYLGPWYFKMIEMRDESTSGERHYIYHEILVYRDIVQ